MEILFRSFHHIDVPGNLIRDIEIPAEFNDFMVEFLKYSQENDNVKLYRYIDKNTEALSCVQSIARCCLNGSDAEEFATSIATKLLREEIAAQQAVDRMHIVIQKGSLIQTLFKAEDGSLLCVIAKVEHSSFYEAESLHRRYGFPGDKKSVWKYAVIALTSQGDLSDVDIRIFNNTSSKYWTEKFLELQEKRSDQSNTREVFNAVERVLCRAVKKKSERDYVILHNALIQKMKTPHKVNYTDMVDELVGTYIPNEEDLDIQEVKSKLNELPHTGKFDTQFITYPHEIKERKRTVKYNPSAGIELKLDGAVAGVEDKVTAEIIDAKRYIKIHCDDNNTFNAFRVSNPE